MQPRLLAWLVLLPLDRLGQISLIRQGLEPYVTGSPIIVIDKMVSRSLIAKGDMWLSVVIVIPGRWPTSIDPTYAERPSPQVITTSTPSAKQSPLLHAYVNTTWHAHPTFQLSVQRLGGCLVPPVVVKHKENNLSANSPQDKIRLGTCIPRPLIVTVIRQEVVGRLYTILIPLAEPSPPFTKPFLFRKKVRQSPYTIDPVRYKRHTLSAICHIRQTWPVIPFSRLRGCPTVPLGRHVRYGRYAYIAKPARPFVLGLRPRPS